MKETLVKVENLSKKFCRSLKRSLWYGMLDLNNEILGKHHGGKEQLRRDEFWALKDVSFELNRGECLGVIGRNGAGKTTLLRILNGLVKPNSGCAEMHGRVGALIALGAGFNPILSGRENIYVNGSVLGLSNREIRAKIDEIIDFSELSEFIDSPVQSYSSGMTVRLGFAVASSLSPDILILDEVLAVGDSNFQSKCYQRIGECIKNSAVILVSHFPHHIKKLCDKTILLEKGQIIQSGSPEQILKLYDQRNTNNTLKPLVLLGEGTKNALIENVSQVTSTGENLEFDFIIEVTKEIKCDQTILNIVDNNESVHAQIQINGLEILYKKGLSKFRVNIGPLFLTAGHYSGNIGIFGNNGKSTIAHLRNCFSFYFDGPPSLGPVYRPPSIVVKL